MHKLTYRCKNCGWERSIPEQWADVGPRYCGNRKCKYSGQKRKEKTSFLKEPEMLETIYSSKLKDFEVSTEEVQQVITEMSEDKSLSRRAKRKKARGI